MSEGNNFHANVKIAFIGPVFIFTGISTILIVGTILAVLLISHWAQVVAWSGWIAIGFVLIVAAVIFLLIALLAAHVYEKWSNARSARMKNKVLHIQNDLVVIEQDGQVIPHFRPNEQYRYNIRQVEPLKEETKLLEAPKPQLPILVRYEDIKSQIPQNHALVGVSEHGVETKEEGQVKPCIWIVGGSGTGKSNSTALRVDEDYERDYGFLLADPHKFKPDSLYNAIRGYEQAFLFPVAQSLEDIHETLDAFLDEFERRKRGGTWHKRWRLLIDEVGSLTSDIDPKNELEVNVARKIKETVRVCGQETRDFGMGGIFCSQDAAGLSWLRKRALMVIAHQVLMMSERLLVCNQNAEVARDMDTWPIGRTLIYGIGFREGQRVFQQPVFTYSRIVDADKVDANMPDLPMKNTSHIGTSKPVGIFFERGSFSEQRSITGSLITNVKPLREGLPNDFPTTSQATTSREVTDKYQFSDTERTILVNLYKKLKNIDDVLATMERGARWHRSASTILKEEGLL